jgi:hypothetical protein
MDAPVTIILYGIRNAEDVATCLQGYDQTAYPEGTDWTFTRFCLPQAFDALYSELDLCRLRQALRFHSRP